jgi:hypothetical protein
LWAAGQPKAQQVRKLHLLIALLNFNNNSLSVKLSFKLLGVRLANERWANLRLRPSTRRLGKRSLLLTQATVFGCQKVKKHLTGKQPPEVA